MAEIHAVSFSRHGNKRWSRAKDYFIYQRDTIAALNAQELPAAMMAVAIGLIPEANGFTTVAIQSLQATQNLYVAPNGSWQGEYIPAIYRNYPFQVLKNTNNDDVLCINEGSGLINESDTGELFFTTDGKPTDGIQELFRSLVQYEKNKTNTRNICDILQKYELIQPWELKVKNDEVISNVDGFYRIDEAKLNSLPTEAFLELRTSGALLVAYCQLLSMQKLPLLGKLAAANAQAARSIAQDVGAKISEEHGILSFSNF